MSTPRVEALLQDIRLASESNHELVQRVRKAALALAAGVSEEVKYGGILFAAPTPFCGVFAYATHVSLEFSHGAALPDAHGRLEGQGKLRRHIKLRRVEEIAEKQVAHYLALAHAAAAG